MKEMRVFKSIIKYLILAVLGLVVLFNCLSFVVSMCSDKPGRIIGRFYAVETGSMAPKINEGDLIYVRRAPVASLEAGDAVTVVIGGKTVTHELLRVSGTSLVTQGLGNENEDLPTAFEKYLGKVTVIIPAGAVIYDVLTSVTVCVAATAAFLILLLLGPVVRLILRKTERLKIGATRITAMVAAASVLLVPGASTLARYSASFDVGKAVSTAEMNFSSNFLSESGNRYDIVGWNGMEYYIDLRLSNYSNLLKYNGEGVDVMYRISFEKILDDGTETYTDNYQLQLANTSKEQIVESNGIKTTTAIPWTGCEGSSSTWVDSSSHNVIKYESGIYTLSGGIRYNENVRLTVDARKPGGGVYLSDDEKIKFRVTAQTISNTGYAQTLTAVYTMTMTTAEHFIENRSLDQTVGTQVVKLNIKSATIIGIDDKKVVIDWDPTTMYLNEYESNTLSLIAAGTLILDKTNGTLTFSMKASASMTFEFYKRTNCINKTLDHEFLTKTDDEGIEYEYLRIFAVTE